MDIHDRTPKGKIIGRRKLDQNQVRQVMNYIEQSPEEYLATKPSKFAAKMQGLYGLPGITINGPHVRRLGAKVGVFYIKKPKAVKVPREPKVLQQISADIVLRELLSVANELRAMLQELRGDPKPSQAQFKLIQEGK